MNERDKCVYVLLYVVYIFVKKLYAMVTSIITMRIILRNSNSVTNRAGVTNWAGAVLNCLRVCSTTAPTNLSPPEPFRFYP
jgi:hypothetical protein